MASRKIIQIGEHRIELPPYPTSKSEILFFEEKMPYWRRQTDLPKLFFDYNKYHTAINRDLTLYDNDGVLISLSEEDTKLLQYYQTRELRRRTEGVWFKNGTDIIWMPGDYYFNLQWGPMLSLPQQYGDFRWFQNDVMILKSKVDTDPDDLGLYLAKAKKTGISQIMSGAYVNEATMIRGKNFGIMSKTFEQDAKPLNMALIFHIIERLPDILMPEERKRNEHEIIFGRSKNYKTLKTQTKPLNTRIFASKTKPTGFDGPVMHKVWLDEFPKYWEAAKQSPELVFNKTQETVKKQQIINGKMYLTSYSPEDDNRGYREARKIYFESKLATRDKILNRTKSNLICHTIGTLESAEGTFLPNGKTDQKKAFYFNEAERNAVKNDKSKYLAKQRQYPRNEDEAWGTSGMSTVFDTIRIGFQKSDLEAMHISGARPYQEGRLIWANQMWELGKFDARPKGQFCPVFFEALTEDQISNNNEGRLHIFEMPAPEQRCLALLHKSKDENGKIKPLQTSINIGGIDPTDYANASTVNVGSKNAAYCMNLYDPILDTKKNRVASNILLSEYFFRPENPDEFYEDMVKEIIFFDKRVIVEANKKWLVTKLINEGLYNYLLLRKSDGTISPYKEGDENKLVSTTHDLIDSIVRLIKRYTAEVVGQDAGIDYLKHIKSKRLLDQLGNFDPTNTKIYDLVMAFGYTRLAAESFSIFKNSENVAEDDVTPEQMQILMKKITGI